jgi:hypothetical protein
MLFMLLLCAGICSFPLRKAEQSGTLKPNRQLSIHPPRPLFSVPYPILPRPSY